MKTRKSILSPGVSSSFVLCSLALFCLTGLLLASCASAPPYPVYPEPMTKVFPVSYESVFKSALAVLKHDKRLELHTIDKAGRFVAWEKTSGFIIFQHRTVFDIALSPEGEDTTKLSMKLSAQRYSTGGLTREAGWYPSPQINTLLAEDVMSLIEQEVAKSES